jgi:HSP20 family protein
MKPIREKMAWIKDEDINELFKRMFRNIGFNGNDLNIESWSYGYSITTGPDGNPIIKEWGTGLPDGRKPLRPQPYIPETPEPLSQVDVDLEKQKVRVIVEIPGFTKESIKINGAENKIQILARSETRSINTDIPINVKVDPKSAEATYKNGVLDITLKVVEVPKSNGVEIKVN